MTADKIRWLTEMLNGLLQAGACYDCMQCDDTGETDDHDFELLEAINGDIDRAYRGLERILVKYDSLPEHCKSVQIQSSEPRIDSELPF